MNIKYTGVDKGLTPFEWINIPMFAILTGVNGSGKSQLLALLSRLAIVDQTGKRTAIPGLEVSNFECQPNEVTYVAGEWQLKDTRPLNMQAIQQIASQVKSRITAVNASAKLVELRHTIEKQTGKRVKDLTEEDFAACLPPDFYEQESSMPEQISRIFIDYQIGYVHAKHYGTETEFLERNGKAPWLVLKEILTTSALPFTFNNPEEEKFDPRRPFHFRIFDKGSKKQIPFKDLSSGEKVLVSLIFYLYNSDSRQKFPKLFLMDEPDAHLHPSMTHQFLRVIKTVLVDKYNVRVIMATHSPSTIALSDQESIFVMAKPTTITNVRSKNQAISLLTSGLVFVGQGTKIVIVEDNDDVEFYNEALGLLLAESIITRDIPIAFIPASSKKAEKSGGKSVVNDWASKFNDSQLGSIIQGLIDFDSGNTSSPGVHLLKRYSIENYLVDPIVVFGGLLATGSAPDIAGVDLAFGDENRIRLLNAIQLQEIANRIHEKILPLLKDALPNEPDETLFDQEFTNGVVLKYPQYLVASRGKDLLPKYLKAFQLKHHHLHDSFRRIKLMPIDFKVLFEDIQKS